MVLVSPGGVRHAAQLMRHRLAQDSEMCLNQLQNGPNNALLDMVGKFMKPRELFKVWRKRK